MAILVTVFIVGAIFSMYKQWQSVTEQGTEPGALVTGPVNIPTNKHCGEELNVPNVTSWQEAVSGLYRRRLLVVGGPWSGPGWHVQEVTTGQSGGHLISNM